MAQPRIQRLQGLHRESACGRLPRGNHPRYHHRGRGQVVCASPGRAPPAAGGVSILENGQQLQLELQPDTRTTETIEGAVRGEAEIVEGITWRGLPKGDRATIRLSHR